MNHPEVCCYTEMSRIGLLFRMFLLDRVTIMITCCSVKQWESQALILSQLDRVSSKILAVNDWDQTRDLLSLCIHGFDECCDWSRLASTIRIKCNDGKRKGPTMKMDV
jgi:hypothetical protein